MPVIPERLRPRSRAGRVGLVAGGVVAGLLALDLIALTVAALFGAELLKR